MKNNYFTLVILLAAILSTPVFGQNNLQTTAYGTIISNYLEERKSDLNLNDQDLNHLIVTNSYYSKNTDLTQVYINQTFNGIKIFNAISSLAIKDDKVFYYANRFINDISNKVNSMSPTMSPISAIEKVATQLRLGSIQNIEQLEHNINLYEFSNAGISSENIKVELVYVKKEDRLILAWDLIIYAKDNEHWWSVRVNAITNEIIDKKDLIVSCTFEENHTNAEHSNSLDFMNLVTHPDSFLVDGSSYNVFALPTESPNHGSRQKVIEPASLEASPFGWHDDNGIIGAEYTITRGNNVWAKENVLGNSSMGLSPNGTESLNFDFPLDFDLSPLDYQDAAITNLFYVNNMMHDIFYQHGFDESSGNFQKTNYTNLGLGEDFVRADAQDGSFLNNASFGTPPDGFRPQMQMYLFSLSLTVPREKRVHIENGNLAGFYEGIGVPFSPYIIQEPVISSLVLATDMEADIYDVCETITNPESLDGNIAVLRRGDCEIGAQVLAVQNAGAIGAIVVNNSSLPALFANTSTYEDNILVQSLLLPQDIGESVITALINGETITAELLGPDITDFIDSDLDNGVIAHEYSHGISNRLTGGPSIVSCLLNEDQMGEGWSDWFALMTTMKQTDLPNDARGIGTFIFNQPATGEGIRPARYSIDFAENNFTYDASNTLARPHGIGFVWATMLWDLTWAYIDKYGFDDDMYNGNGGNNKIVKLVIDGLKLQPCSPGFIDGRDAILAADIATTGGVNQCMIWEVFAARGLGFNANQGDPNDRTDQIEDFSMPPSNDLSLANCSSLSVNEFSKDILKIYPNPTQSELSISTSMSLGNVAITIVDINGRIVLEFQKELFDTITLNIDQLQSGLYILNIEGDRFNYNEKIVKD